MRLGTTAEVTIFSRSVRIAGISAVAALTFLGTVAPALADTAGPPPALPDNAYVVTQAADGQLQVVTGNEASEVVDNAADGRPGPAVLSVQPDQAVHALDAGGENDPLRSQQWALDRTSFESAWSLTRGRSITVAVIDSGVLANHQDLTGTVLSGIDYVKPGGDGRIDPNGHGTHVAGIIAAHVNNALGIAGAAPDVRILPVRVLDANGGGVASNVAKGIIWAADHGARVDQPQPRRRTVVRSAPGHPVREQQGRRRVRRRRQQRADRQLADVPGCLPRSRRRRRGRHRSLAPGLQQHRQLHRRVGARRRHRLLVGLVHHRLRLGHRNFDGHALRRGRRRAHHRRASVIQRRPGHAACSSRPRRTSARPTCSATD